MSANQQLPLPISLGDKSSFNNFLSGQNDELVSALDASVANGEPKLLFLYGPAGSGKSHLLFATMRLAKESGKSATYISLADPNFENLEQATAVLEMVDVAQLVCVDDLQSWAGDSERERALFALFEQVRHAGGQLLLAGHFAPEQAGFMLRDLVSRIGSGLIYAVHALKDDELLSAIQLRTRERGLRIDDDVVRYLLSRTSRDTHDLFSLLDTIDQASLIEKRRITIPFLQRFLAKAEP